MSLKTILKNFLNHVDTLEAQRKLGKDLYEIDFQKLKGLTEQLKHEEDHSCSEGLKDVNKRKNRYKDILPYDCTRVVLSDYPGVPGSDFINANYIKGASGSLAYIASQGPLPNTVVDFWRMIWECEVQVIIMACNEQESGKYKCECYWPGDDDDQKQYGNITVELVKWRQVCPDFLVRTLKACWEDEERVLCQFHYTTWPDHGVPNSVQPILELVRLIRDCQASEAVPVLIHCSAGCGRTGTICAIDYVWGLMRMGKLTKSFNLFNVISDMRRQRIAMVQTKEQYVLVHKAVSSLFEQQLRVIDSHTYENLDEDGEPLILKELQPEEVLYEDILGPECYEKLNRSQDRAGDIDNSSYKSLEYGSRNLTDMESHCLVRHEKLDKSVFCSNLDSSVAYPLERLADLSVILPQDYQATAIAQEILNDIDVKDSCSRNSTILLKLRREESVKRLISGWNKATQQQHHLDSSTSLSNADQVRKTESIAKESQKHKFDCEEALQLKQAVIEQIKEQNNIKCVNTSSAVEEHGIKDSEKTSCISSNHKSKRSNVNETHRSGKLVGKATVIRRPSIAKLKALFEKSATNSTNAPTSDRHPEESSRRRRPLFRSHSHYVGHSRTFSVPDGSDSQADSTIPYGEDTAKNPLQNVTPNCQMEHFNAHSENHGNDCHTFISPSPDKFVSDHCESSGKKDQNIFFFQPVDNMHDVYKSKVDGCNVKSHGTVKSIEETNVKQLDGCAYFVASAPSKAEETAKETPCFNTDDVHQQIVPVHQRIKQYSSSIINEKPPILPTKKRLNPKDCYKPSEQLENRGYDKSLVENALDAGTENYSFKSSISKTESSFLPPSAVIALSEIEGKLCASDRGLQSEIAKQKLFYSGFRDLASVSNTLSSKCPEVNQLADSSEQKFHLNETCRKEDGFHIYMTPSKHTAQDMLYSLESNPTVAQVKHSFEISVPAQKELKYMNVNSITQKNLQQIEEKLKNHPRGAIIDLTSRKSYIDESQNLSERPPLFISTNQPVKLSQPMESHELKAPEKVKDQSTGISKAANQDPATVFTPAQNSTQHNKHSKNNQNDNKNLLLHSPPPKSKRNHASKSSHCVSHRDKAATNEPQDCISKTDKSTHLALSSSNSRSTKSQGFEESERTVTKSLSNSYEPANRSDPRYFPVTRQTPEDARYASEKQKAFASKKAENHEGYYSTSFVQKDVKTSFQYAPHKKIVADSLEGNTKKPLAKAYTTHMYKQYDPNSSWPTKDNEQIYGTKPQSNDHHVLYSRQDVSISSKDIPVKMQSSAPSTSTHMQHSRNASAPAAYGAIARENIYGTNNKHNVVLSQNSYPQGPPKPPRTFNHKFKPRELETLNQEKTKHSTPEGGRYIVSVASPKQSADTPLESHNIEYQYYSSVPKRQVPDKIHVPYSSNDQHMSRSYPFVSCDSSSAKVPEVNAHANYHPLPTEDHIYHTIREKPNQACESSAHNVKSSNKYSDYENTFDAQREYLDAMTNSSRNVATYNYLTGQGTMPVGGIQYSQSDASIYAVLQNQNPVKPSSSSTWQQSPYDLGAGSAMPQNDVNAVPKRVYFDTLQRRHKQHVSWEQRRSHDDMDIRPAPSARLKEQIHARRSMVELDNLEISIAGENGFHEQNPLAHSILQRKDFVQESLYASGRPPAELSDSLLSKDANSRKNQMHGKESGSFGGTLYKAFGKLTSLTKFNAKDTPSKNLSETGSKAPLPKEEKPEPNNVSSWTPRKPKEQSELSEQWTEV